MDLNMQDKCNIKETQNMYDKIIDEDIKRCCELQILIEQEEKKNYELVEKYAVMIKEKSQRLRDLHKYFKKENIEKDLEMTMEQIEKLTNKKKQLQNIVDELQRESDEMKPLCSSLISIMDKEANN